MVDLIGDDATPLGLHTIDGAQLRAAKDELIYWTG